MKTLTRFTITILFSTLILITFYTSDIFAKPIKEGERCYTDGRKDSSGNYITTCCYASYDGNKFLGRFCEDCTIHDGGDVIICDDPYEESSRNPGNIRPGLNDNVIDQPLTADPQPSLTNKDTIIGDRLSGSDLGHIQPSDSQNSATSIPEEIQSDSTGLGTAFNAQEESDEDESINNEQNNTNS